VIGIVFALIVMAIILSAFGVWIVGIPFAIVALILFVLILAGFGRHTAAGRP
jgi:Na+/melibiose symporter-like transporter